jgi:hypothetical protein
MNKGQFYLPRPLQPVRLQSLVYLERAEVSIHKIKVKIDYIIISNKLVKRKIKQILTPNINYI